MIKIDKIYQASAQDINSKAESKKQLPNIGKNQDF